jgi:hypothetical protein
MINNYKVLYELIYTSPKDSIKTIINMDTNEIEKNYNKRF